MYKKKNKNTKQPFKWKHFTGEIILWLVRWYCRYALSYGDLKEMAQERGLLIERSTIMRWVHEYSPGLENRIRLHLKMSYSSIRIDETYLKVKGVWHYLYRAVDKHSQTLDWMLRCLFLNLIFSVYFATFKILKSFHPRKYMSSYLRCCNR